MRLPSIILLLTALLCQVFLLMAGSQTRSFLEKDLAVFKVDFSNVWKNVNPLQVRKPNERFKKIRGLPICVANRCPKNSGLVDEIFGVISIPQSIEFFVLTSCDEYPNGNRECAILKLSPFTNSIVKNHNANKIWQSVGISAILMAGTTGLRLCNNLVIIYTARKENPWISGVTTTCI
ncbi:hypothetical protein AOL_s00091g9 [Orbilia oligospora ATCC 24927]|uniref:Uncharacterized protein n=1 Tax=Arthrobotrys oligospora (strain ATCC 24927 / CBS 115.81 / DSM 1491) TaxID=756982 RepID=G1XHV7_ARTOA|nr:hypothetical protein AOL_s00091g9 [Orbilia oligospora ATCC 24927]EGX47265.1 hypothetical protein AOL_s00091g9 [Orbilia oligospora ATCC 24927]